MFPAAEFLCQFVDTLANKTPKLPFGESTGGSQVLNRDLYNIDVAIIQRAPHSKVIDTGLMRVCTIMDELV